MVYKACILSRIDYGAQAYGCASPELLQNLNIIQNKALRIIALDNFSGKSLEVEFDNQYRQSVIFSDNLSYIQSIQGNQSNRPDIVAALQI